MAGCKRRSDGELISGRLALPADISSVVSTGLWMTPIARIPFVDKAFRGLTASKIVCMCEAVGDPGRVDFALLTHAQRVDELARIQRERARLDAREARLLHAMHADPLPNIDGSPAADKQWVREDVACVLRIAPQTAAGRLHDASDLVTGLPTALAMLERGELTRGHVLRLIEGARQLPRYVLPRLERRVLRRAADQSIAQFGASVRRAVLGMDPRSANDRAEDAQAARRVIFTPQPDGITELWAPLPAAGAAALEARVQAEADRLKTLDAQQGITRTADQRRADALINLATDCQSGSSAGGDRPGPGLQPDVNVIVAFSTLLGLDEQPGELDGYGPIPATVARALAFDPTGTWRRLLTDENGRLVDVSAASYRPPAPLARLVKLQQPRCSFRGCRRRATRCELDHVVPWPHGATCPANLQPLCPRHHHLKHEAGWRPVKESDGTTVWTSPSGHTYARPPDDLPIDTTTSGNTTSGNTSTGNADPGAAEPIPDDDPPPF
jgi:hypothetical protein